MMELCRGGAENGGPMRQRFHVKRMAKRVLTASTALSFTCAHALAQTSENVAPALSSRDVAVLSAFSGILAATVLATLWFVRLRGRSEAENRALREERDAAHERIANLKALNAEKNRRIIFWEGPKSAPEFLGSLPEEAGAPEDDDAFLKFSEWLSPGSRRQLETAVTRLRKTAKAFEMLVETRSGYVLEVLGSTTGGRAHVRFGALESVRAELAELKIEHKQVNETLSRFEQLLDVTEMPAWIRNGEGQLVWANRAYVKAVEGETAEDTILQNRMLLNTPTQAKLDAALRDKKRFDGRHPVVIDGERTFFEISEVPFGEGSAGIARDVSALEAAEATLRQTVEGHAETLNHLNTAVAIFDADKRLEFYNEAFEKLWKLDIGFLESKPDNAEMFERLRADSKLPEPYQWKEWKDKALSVYRSVEPYSDLWYLPSGETLSVFASANPRGGATWVFENHTEQVALKTRYNTLVKVQGETIDHLSEGVAVFGPDGRLKLANPAFQHLWQIDEKNAEAGTHIRALMKHCEKDYDGSDGWRLFARMITSFDDKRESHQGRLDLRSGLVLDYAVTPLPNAQTMLTFVNKTDSVHVERALTDKNDALRKAEELKNAFLEHVSHELRTPLTSIMGFAELLKSPEIGPLTKRQSNYVDHIANSSSVLMTIVNDMIDLKSADAGILQLDHDTMSLDDLIDSVADDISSRLQEAGITLEITAPPSLGQITADFQRLKQVLLKILGNAIKYAPRSSVIALSCWRENSDFVFTVTDNGPGISEEQLGNVFSRFESGERQAQYAGAGLGLAIVESFVRLHNGKVFIDSEPGAGTTVSCRIPDATEERDGPEIIAAE
ncbi:PAS domain-containing protein [Martelella mediterranea]|uniref:histidine kinase n=2 Tax=Martelella mediterranea TaxID=293089 RepID=A0A4V6P0B8_9HYPH|nr:PAS domain-containing protein [Martelella mediterranea]